MNLKAKVKSYSFWVSLASAFILILKLVGQKFGFAVDEGLISDLFTSLCAILVIMGIIVVPNPSSLETKADKVSLKNEIITTENLAEKPTHESAETKVLENSLSNESGLEAVVEVQENQTVCQNESCEVDIQSCEKAQEMNFAEISQPSSEEVCQSIVLSEPIQDINSSITDEKTVSADSFDMSKKLESFIDKVCTKRSELSANIATFVDFLQSELDSVKNRNN